MANQKTLSAEDFNKAIEARPDGFLFSDSSKARGTKTSQNKYIDNYVICVDGKKLKCGISWKNTALASGIKAPEDRKFGVNTTFRESSGPVGKALVAIYAEFTRSMEANLKNKTIIAKGAKANICSPVQTQLESGELLDSPLIRLKLPFNKNGNAEFRLVRIEKDENGNPKQVDIKCTEENVHTIIRSRMITSGYATMDTIVQSGFGISMPLKVQLLVIKPADNESPEIDSILSREEMLEMVGDMGDNNCENKEDDAKNDTEAYANTENVPLMGDQLEALRKMALVDDNNEE
jgi:hypothetical protein